ncbi:squalene/phytoene synthase family protein [Litoreibacter roseus]|uniref:Phytoene synthase n=1 Tax=Litoreibacter roseus TaxID=2601869 RepID=A0A6N6JEL8_9RHOB|nr:squalene/phytoene synthase family protein [Litoreibacter roseus]GFE64260.1 phytoene synthase [Litoreibacter roseus]
MSLEACADLIARADPDRFAAIRLAPIEAQQILLPIYAFNVEVSRAPWVTQEPMIAEMRLQWWRDALDEIANRGIVRAHEVTVPLAQVLDAGGAAALDKAVAARRWDIFRDPFENAEHFEEFIASTSGNVMWTAARLLGAEDESGVRNFAFGVGISNWLQAIPALLASGRQPLLEGNTAAIRDLADEGLRRIDSAARARKTLSAAEPVLLTGWTARPMLDAARRNPEAVLTGLPQLSPFRRDTRLAKLSYFGWWR